MALTVPDLEAAVEWYVRVLGLEVLFDEEGGTRRASVLRFPDGPIAIGLVWHAGATGRFDPTVVGLDHAAFSVATRDDLVRWAERLDAEGVEHSGVVDAGPGAILNFKDPAGIALAIFWDKPG